MINKRLSPIDRILLLQEGTQRNDQSGANRGATFVAVCDSRKRKVPGLWKRETKFYAQLRIDLSNDRTAPRRIAFQVAVGFQTS